MNVLCLCSRCRISAGYMEMKRWYEISRVLDYALFVLVSSHCFVRYDSGITSKTGTFSQQKM
jgi:hypothetical protein